MTHLQRINSIYMNVSRGEPYFGPDDTATSLVLSVFITIVAARGYFPLLVIDLDQSMTARLRGQDADQRKEVVLSDADASDLIKAFRLITCDLFIYET